MALDENNLEKKLENVSNSQDSIQSLSLWILHHKNHHKRIVQIWMKALRKGKINHRLTLFYLANDVIQHARRKNINVYVEEFGLVLKEATDLVKEDRIKSSVNRVFNIWRERNVYPSEFIDELKAILSGNTTSVYDGNTSKIVAEFKLPPLIDKIKKVKKLESYTKSKIDSINSAKIEALSCEVLNHLKDKSHGEQFSKDFDEATKHLEAVIHSLERGIAVRNELIDTLEKSEIFYDIQKGEAKIVANAYKNFALRVKSVKKKLCDSKKSLPSPLPSPSIDAPSPTNSDDGPMLPGMESSLKALMSTFSDGSSNNGQLSSLDKRLSNLMQNIPMVANENNDYGINQPIVDMSALQQVSHIHFAQDLYSQITYNDYDYCHTVPGGNDVYTNEMSRNIQAQPIQSVISSRSEMNTDPSDISSNIRAYDYGDVGSQQSRENFEIADMDLGNSDDEESSLRNQNYQRVLKVIETRKSHIASHYSSDKMNTMNSDFSNSGVHHLDGNDHHSPSMTHFKASSRLSQRLPSVQTDDRHRWRNNRNQAPIGAHYSTETNQHHSQSRSWKVPRNSHTRGSFNRRY
ncbi:Regulation of nuclear pre-mRNA domain-containing protein 2-like protein [Leptotrombidium deliense]|uniref:Regulation of nuclear pre-mRNA domain-containing protein 2 n=1 Tax=Leptotrombidium deliense TaxID=299467 RepID=A0A443SLC5_9ACAR|nr:Regulation of nuclear pre-mRNA domain-containing protein 2-like protein [Leptotrombidium deliense]